MKLLMSRKEETRKSAVARIRSKPKYDSSAIMRCKCKMFLQPVYVREL